MQKFTSSLIFLLTCLLLLLAPLLYSGKTALSLGVLELLGLLILALIFTIHNFNSIIKRLSPPIFLFIVFGLISTSLYLLPLPHEQWILLPNRPFYDNVLTWLQQQQVSVLLTVSLIPQETVKALLSLIPVLAIFLATMLFAKNEIKWLVWTLLGIAALEASIGLIQYSSHNPVFFFGMPPDTYTAQGTYLNRDHFAALMAISIPFAVGLSIHNIGYRDKYSTHLALIFISISLLVILAGIFSRSRAGLALTILGIVLSTIAFSPHIGGRKTASLTTVIITIVIGCATSIGLVPILNRFMVEDPLEDVRWNIYNNVIIGIKSFWPIGSGLGTFPDVYRAFQPIDQQGFINHAHNDYLELTFDMGVVGVSLITVFFALYLWKWWVIIRRKWNTLKIFQIAAGISLLLILLHSVVDFILHTPANMVLFGFLCGVFFRKAEE